MESIKFILRKLLKRSGIKDIDEFMDKNIKKAICIDFDGVLNNYNGEYQYDNLGTMKKGADTFLKKLSEDFAVVIFTARDIRPVYEWIHENELDEYVLEVTGIKPPAVCYVDDRAVCFEGNFKDTLRAVKNFKPYWEKRGE